MPFWSVFIFAAFWLIQYMFNEVTKNKIHALEAEIAKLKARPVTKDRDGRADRGRKAPTPIAYDGRSYPRN